MSSGPESTRDLPSGPAQAGLCFIAVGLIHPRVFCFCFCFVFGSQKVAECPVKENHIRLTGVNAILYDLAMKVENNMSDQKAKFYNIL